MQTQETSIVYNGIQDEILKTKPVYDLLREFDGIEINKPEVLFTKLTTDKIKIFTSKFNGESFS